MVPWPSFPLFRAYYLGLMETTYNASKHCTPYKDYFFKRSRLNVELCTNYAFLVKCGLSSPGVYLGLIHLAY